jgi:hypothetical protein
LAIVVLGEDVEEVTYFHSCILDLLDRRIEALRSCIKGAVLKVNVLGTSRHAERVRNVLEYR